MMSLVLLGVFVKGAFDEVILLLSVLYLRESKYLAKK